MVNGKLNRIKPRKLIQKVEQVKQSSKDLIKDGTEKCL